MSATDRPAPPWKAQFQNKLNNLFCCCHWNKKQWFLTAIKNCKSCSKRELQASAFYKYSDKKREINEEEKKKKKNFLRMYDFMM